MESAAEPPLKDIAIAVIGGSAAIAAVLLVFVAFLVSRADALPSETPDRVIRRYEKFAKLGFLPLLSQVESVTTAYLWLLHMRCWQLLLLWKYGFLVSLATFLLYAAAVMWML